MTQPLSITDYKLGRMLTRSGQDIAIENPQPEDICITDIAFPLGMICRFGGQRKHFYSVAQHTLLVTQLAGGRLNRAAKLHDASEAYIGDVIKPLKHILGDAYKVLEDKWTAAIFTRFGVPLEQMDEIAGFDKLALLMEDRALNGDLHYRSLIQEKLKHFHHGKHTFWGPEYAGEVLYKAMYCAFGSQPFEPSDRKGVDL